MKKLKSIILPLNYAKEKGGQVMDANGNIIPIVEGDQGEGFKDPYEEEVPPDPDFDEIDPLELLEEQASKVAQEKHKTILKQELGESPALTKEMLENLRETILSQGMEEKKEDLYQDQVDKNLSEVKVLAKQPPPPQLMQIQKGMTIHFYGYAYKCTAARPNGKVTLKLKGLWKGDR